MSSARQALTALFAETLADPAAAGGYTLAGISFGDTVEVALAKGAATFVIWLRPARVPTGSYRQTSRFKLGHRDDPPDRLGYALLDAVCARVAAWEQSLGGDADAELFAAVASSSDESLPYVEWLAVRSGLKPACRSVAAAATAERLTDAARSSGLHVVTTAAAQFVSGFCTGKEDNDTIIYAARTVGAAAAVADAERAMVEAVARGGRVTDAQVRALGAALGYPHCCIEGFLPMRDLSNAEIRFHTLQRTTGAASYLLNDSGDCRVLVSHAVCRYDCPASIRYGSALLDELTRVDRGGAEALARALTALVILFPQGGLRLAPAAALRASPYRFTAVEGAGEGVLFERWRSALRAGDAIDVQPGEARVLRGGEEISRFSVLPAEVQIRPFS
jgi:hypothetical protein